MSPKWIDREGLGKCRTETRQLLNYNWGENKRIAYRGGQPELRFACSFKIGICFSWSKRVKQKIMNMYNSVTIHKIEDAFNLFQTCQVSRIRHRSPSLPYRSPYLPDKIIFWAFLCLSLKFRALFNSKREFFLFTLWFLGHSAHFSHWQRLFLASKQRGLGILIVCTLCKTSYNALNHSHWGLGQFVGRRGGCSEKRDFRSLEAGISAFLISHHCTQVDLLCI